MRASRKSWLVEKYELAIALLDERTDQPKVKLAITGVAPDGWYTLGTVRVQK